ncbi:hypothetical protein GCM10027174_42090 [Salinifilum aidingensis]
MVRGENAWEEYVRWQTRGRGVLERINALIERNGNEGIGEPEPLEHGFQGYWYRRTDEAGPSRGPGGGGPGLRRGHRLRRGALDLRGDRSTGGAVKGARRRCRPRRGVDLRRSAARASARCTLVARGDRWTAKGPPRRSGKALAALR